LTTDSNAYAERVIRSVRQECLDHLLILNRAHLTFVLRQFFAYYPSLAQSSGGVVG